jgi:CHRD domain
MLAITRLLSAFALVAALVALAASPAAAQEGTGAKCTLFTALRPSNEVDPPSNSLAFGAAAVHIDGTRLSFAVAIANLSREAFTAGHIHNAPAGANGTVVVPLFSSDPGVSPRVFFQAGSVGIAAALGADICANPANYYVNYHTEQRPSGTTRGQLG